ncbi:rcc01693 family protein [Pararhodobacter sp.]|uniref:rcc01693 family protein n=1 Tax=Pararhodobacter sp. TaxID=2127056 RepID=UPI002FDEA1F4
MSRAPGSEARGLDWPGLMRAGLHGLRLTPAQFWALTPVELMIMLGRENTAPAFTRARLESLLARFPDRPGKQGQGMSDGKSGRSERAAGTAGGAAGHDDRHDLGLRL